MFIFTLWDSFAAHWRRKIFGITCIWECRLKLPVGTVAHAQSFPAWLSKPEFLLWGGSEHYCTTMPLFLRNSSYQVMSVGGGWDTEGQLSLGMPGRGEDTILWGLEGWDAAFRWSLTAERESHVLLFTCDLFQIELPSMAQTTLSMREKPGGWPS